MHMDQMTLMAYLRHCNDPEVAERVLRSASYVYEHQKRTQERNPASRTGG